MSLNCCNQDTYKYFTWTREWRTNCTLIMAQAHELRMLHGIVIRRVAAENQCQQSKRLR